MRLLQSASRRYYTQIRVHFTYLELAPFNKAELAQIDTMQQWNRGGFPLSLLSRSDKVSLRWRENFIATYLERDIPQLGFNIPARTLRRLWTILSHNQGQLLNYSKIGVSLGVSHTTVRSYIDLLTQTFMVRLLEPFDANIKKRQVKSPKTFIRDSGILHALLGIENLDMLFGHTVYGNSWEGFALENVLTSLPEFSPYFYRTSSGVEIDLILQKGTQLIAVKFKASKSPKLSKGFFIALEDLRIDECWVIAPVDDPYLQKSGITISNLNYFLKKYK